MLKIDAETAFELHLLQNIYKKPKIPTTSINNIDLTKLIRLSARNNVGYYTCKMLQNNYGNQLSSNFSQLLKQIIDQCEKTFLNLENTLKTLDCTLDDYLLHKTYRGYSRIPSDIDVIVHDLEKAVKKLESAGFSITADEGHAVMLLDNNGVKVHLHGKISWANSVFFDQELVFHEPRKVNVWNSSVQIPNFNADLLIHIAHINFEPLHFTLSDFLYICNISRFVDYEVLLSQAKKYHWMHSFNRSISMISDYEEVLYSSPHAFDSLNLENPPKGNQEIKFPKDLPRNQIILAFLEKRPISYLISKLSKALFIIASGDTYQAYYHPPEFTLITKALNNFEK